MNEIPAAHAEPADPIAAVVHPDPSGYYAELARRDGLWFDATLKLHVASAPAAVREVLAHPSLHVRPAHEPVPSHLAGTAAGDLFGALIRMNEGDRHAGLKPIVASALATPPANARALADDAWRVAATYAHELGLVGGRSRTSPADARAIDAWIRYTPATIVARQVGFGPGEAARVARDVEAFVAAFGERARADAAATAAASLRHAGEQLAAAPPPGSLAARIAPEAARAGIAPQRVVANLVGLVSQTFEATAALLGNALVALARLAGRDAAPARALADDAGLVDWVAGVSRSDPSIHNTRRFAAADVDVFGTRVTAGAPVLVVLAAVHQEFGAARHACPGRDAALAVVCHSLRALLQSGFDVSSLPRDVRYRPLPNVRFPIFFDDLAGNSR